jgi:ABC-type proline/glycine betaine transport system ATPase subunit
MESQPGKIEVDVDAAAKVTEFKISPNAPTVLIVMGMAGSGKTTFVQVSSPHTV